MKKRQEKPSPSPKKTEETKNLKKYGESLVTEKPKNQHICFWD